MNKVFLTIFLIGITVLSGCVKQKKLEFIGGKYNATISENKINYMKEGNTYSGYIEPKFTASLEWIKTNTPDNSLFLSWWDYGHMIRGYAEREVIIHSPSKVILWTVADPTGVAEFSSHEKILDVATALTTTNSTVTVEIMEKYGANYIFVTNDDQNKAWVLFDITGKNKSQYISRENEFTDLGKQSMLYKLLNNVDSFPLVYQDENVKIYSKD